MRAPSDPAWTADGFVSDRWMPVSPVSGRLDAFQWKVPLAEIAAEREVIDAAARGARDTARKPESSVVTPAVTAPPPEIPAPMKASAPAQKLQEPDTKELSSRLPAAALPSPPPAAPRAEAVIPLLHVPDDPGPDPSPDIDPEPGSAGVPRGLRLF
jgi:HemY protein